MYISTKGSKLSNCGSELNGNSCKSIGAAVRSFRQQYKIDQGTNSYPPVNFNIENGVYTEDEGDIEVSNFILQIQPVQASRPDVTITTTRDLNYTGLLVVTSREVHTTSLKISNVNFSDLRGVVSLFYLTTDTLRSSVVSVRIMDSVVYNCQGNYTVYLGQSAGFELIRTHFRSNVAYNDLLKIFYHDKDTATRISGCTFVNNQVTDNGLVSVYYGDVRISDCKFNDNVMSKAAIQLQNTYTMIQDSIFDNNRNRDPYSTDGASIGYVLSSDYRKEHIFNVDGCNFTRNSAEYGGAITLYGLSSDVSSLSTSGTIQIVNSNFAENGYHYGGSVSSYRIPVLIKQCTFTNDNGSNGGSIYLKSAGTVILDQVTVQNNNITENSLAYGGAIFSDSTTVNITNNCQFLGCSARYGGSINCAQNSTINIDESTVFKNNIDKKSATTKGNDGQSIHCDSCAINTISGSSLTTTQKYKCSSDSREIPNFNDELSTRTKIIIGKKY
eukprot:gene2589-3209_t